TAIISFLVIGASAAALDDPTISGACCLLYSF
ncbi:hypothetical protein A2U01_0096497, partial [Trifolium medium]|nr:hypothetical protein [Trifolium medium]